LKIAHTAKMIGEQTSSLLAASSGVEDSSQTQNALRIVVIGAGLKNVTVYNSWCVVATTTWTIACARKRK
jgi:hypothetical protein